MSKFSTALPTDTQDFIRSLPKDSFIHGIAFDMEKHEIVVLWENERFETGLTVPVRVPSNKGKFEVFPKTVRDTKDKVVKKPEFSPDQPPQEKPAKPADVIYLTEDQVKVARAAERPLEFYGVTAQWQDVDPKHIFTDGFFYRPKPKSVDNSKTLTVK